jgi:Cft2 family RNA processing exonuclease
MAMPIAAPSPVNQVTDVGTKQRERIMRENDVRQQRQQQVRQVQEAELTRMTTEQAAKVESVLNKQLEVQKTMAVRLEEVVKELKVQTKHLKEQQAGTAAQASVQAKPVRQTRDAVPREPVVDMRSR